MNKTQYSIKISGSGTRKEIAASLRQIADAIHHPTSKGDGLNIDLGVFVEWEDATLLTEINKIDDSDTEKEIMDELK